MASHLSETTPARSRLSLLGIEVRIHWSFPLLLGWLFVAHVLGGEEVGVALESVVLIVALFACVLLHEFGHALVARRFGVRTRSITLYPIGGVARLERIPERPREELLIAIAGPLVNFVIAGALSTFADLPSSADLSAAGGDFWGKLLYLNLSIGLFNLLPAFPMDGGRVLRALLALRIDHVRATQLAGGAGKLVSLLMGLAGVWTGQLMLILISGFVFIAARHEVAAASAHSVMRGVRVAEAMLPAFQTIDASLTLSAAASVLLASDQEAFPVIRDGIPIGVFTRAELLRALAANASATSVEQLAQSPHAIAHANEPLEQALQRLEPGSSSLLVMDGERLVGMLTLEHVAKWLALRAALHDRGARQLSNAHA